MRFSKSCFLQNLCKRESVLTVSNAAPALPFLYACVDKTEDAEQVCDNDSFLTFEQFIEAGTTVLQKDTVRRTWLMMSRAICLACRTLRSISL